MQQKQISTFLNREEVEQDVLQSIFCVCKASH